MTGNFCAAAHLHIIAKRRAACNGATGSNETMPPYPHIMCDMVEIIELAALADNRVTQCAAINAAISPDFDTILQNNAPQLRDFDMRLTRGKAKAINANLRPAMHNNAVTKQAIAHRRIGSDSAISTDNRAVTDISTGTDITARANLSLWADNGIWFNNNTLANNRIGMHSPAILLAILFIVLTTKSCWTRQGGIGIKQLRCQRHSAIRVRANDCQHIGRAKRGMLRLYQHSTGFAGGQLIGHFRIGKETQLVGHRLVKRGNIRQFQRVINIV